MLKRFKGIALLFLLVAVIASGCGGANNAGNSADDSAGNSAGNSAGEAEKSDEQVTIKFLGLAQYTDPPEFKAFLTRFEEKYPNIKVDVISAPSPAEYVNKRNIMLASGESIDLLWGNDIMQTDAKNRGFLMEIKDAAKEIGVDMETDFGNSLPAIEGGQYYRFPIVQNTWKLYYNKKIFDDAGIPYPDPIVPMTWDEVAEVAQKLTNPEKKVYGYFYNHWGMYYYGLGSQLTNGKFYTEDGKSNITAPEFVRSIEWLNDVMNKRKAAMPIAEFISNNTDFLAFFNGGYGMLVGGQWNAQLAATKKDKFPRDWKLGLAPMPVPAEMKGKHMNWSNIDSLTVPKNSKYPKEALTFAKEYVADYTFSSGTLPMYNKVDADKYYEDLANSLKEDDITFDQIKFLFGDPDMINVAEKPVLAVPQEYETIFLDQIIQFYSGSITAEEVLKAVQEKVDKAIQEQKNK